MDEITMHIDEIFLEKFRLFFKEKTGHNISKYNNKFLRMKIRNRIDELNIKSFREYFDKMIIHSRLNTELDSLFYLIINRESDFFRYEDQCEYFNDFIIPDLIKRAKNDNKSTVKILSIGIALGQELYSIAIMLNENKMLADGIDFKIDGYDIVKKNLEFARKGIYDMDMLRYFTRYKHIKYMNYFKKYFSPIDNSDNYIINDELKKIINLEKRNILEENIIEKYDAIFYRNVIIYFEESDKKKSINNIFEALNKNSYLLMGHSEYPVGYRDKFESLFHKNSVIFKKNS